MTDEETLPTTAVLSTPALSSPVPLVVSVTQESINSPPIFPAAASLSIVIVVFLIIVAVLLFVRKVLKNKGIVEGTAWLPQCTCTNDQPSCTEKCLRMAEATDCSVPSCQVFLDDICPSKQQCSTACSRLWSCYCCSMWSGACDEMEVCPSCSAMECPDCSCCGDCCHCTLKVPECSQVTCLCFECGRPPQR